MGWSQLGWYVCKFKGKYEIAGKDQAPHSYGFLFGGMINSRHKLFPNHEPPYADKVLLSHSFLSGAGVCPGVYGGWCQYTV